MKVWDVKHEYKPGDDLLDILLNNRNIITPEQKKLFLSPPGVGYWVSNMPKDFLKSLKNASLIVKKNIDENLPIIIIGDYDVDGVCATSIIFKALRFEMEYNNVSYLIPDRFEHGYGLSTEAIGDAIKNAGNPKKGLFITVDTGITAVEETKIIKDLGFEIIITDHHQKPEDLPSADEIVWSDKVVGSTLAWLLARALGSKDPQLLGLCALATVTDLQPLLDMNRSIVKEGIEILNKNPPVGVNKLLEVAGRKGEITTYDLGWVIGPRLNATGRITNARSSFELLIEEDEQKSTELAWKLNKVNFNRQEKTIEMYDLASLDNGVELPYVVVSHDEKYHEGIIGLVAAKLVQKYHRPSIVISVNGDEAKGSVRSIKGIDIIESLREIKHLFTNLGGHPMAAGFSIESKNIQEMEVQINEVIKRKYGEEHFKKILEIDAQIPGEIISIETLNNIKSLKPFGMGNREPLFCTKNMGVSQLNFVGKESNHVSLRLFDGERVHKAIYFNAADQVEGIKTGDKIDVAYTFSENEFNGKVYLDLVVKDIKNSDNI